MRSNIRFDLVVVVGIITYLIFLSCSSLVLTLCLPFVTLRITDSKNLLFLEQSHR